MFSFFSSKFHISNVRRDHFQSTIKEIIRYYGPDWVLTIALVIIFFAIDGIPGFKREFSIYDPTIHYTFATKERVPTVALYLIAVAAPLIIMPIVNLFTIRSFWDFHISSLALILGLAITGVITQFVKLTVGRPRPDLIARCILPQNITQPEFGLSTVAICLQTDRSILTDGWRSFPSGHSSLSFAGLGFLSYYTASKVHLYFGRGASSKAWLSLTPLAGASLVAISRTMDYRHHWQDVIAGSLLGLVVSYFAFRLYYPSLRSPHPEYPLSMQDGQDPILPLTQDEDGRVMPFRPGHMYQHSSELLRMHYRDNSVGAEPPVLTSPVENLMNTIRLEAQSKDGA